MSVFSTRIDVGEFGLHVLEAKVAMGDSLWRLTSRKMRWDFASSFLAMCTAACLLTFARRRATAAPDFLAV